MIDNSSQIYPKSNRINTVNTKNLILNNESIYEEID